MVKNWSTDQRLGANDLGIEIPCEFGGRMVGANGRRGSSATKVRHCRQRDEGFAKQSAVIA